MRLLLIATVVALLLIACNGPGGSTSGVDAEDTVTETPQRAGATPSGVLLTPDSLESDLIETPEHATATASGVPPTPKSPENDLIETPEFAEASPTGAPLTPESPGNDLIETPEYTGVIVSEHGASEFGYLLDGASTEFWEPSSDDVSSAEKCIRQLLASLQQDPGAYRKEDAAFILDNLEQYRRQYVGIVVDGEKRIWCNAFLDHDSFPNWERVPVDVDGGGNHYWQIEYVLPMDECIKFHIHGES